MCGLLGVIEYRRRREVDADLLDRSAQLLMHRGPDDQGFHVGKHVGFAHTRLALLDLTSRAAQPMHDPSGRFCLVFNGEIYNHQALRAGLASGGVDFRTTSDTEVLLWSLIQWGVRSAIRRLEGMFAFALYDRETGTVTLGRDRFGMKPLFYVDDGSRMIFTSEIRALRPWIKFEPDPLSIGSFLHGFGGPTQGHTFYKGVRALFPGGIAFIEFDRAPTIEQSLPLDEFWDPDAAATLSKRRPRELVDQVEAAITDSVRGQLVADAKVGALCSGGVDSSLILAIAARHHTDLSIFHADVVGRHSERQAAERLARHLGLTLEVVEVPESDVIDLLPEVMDHQGHPFVETPHSVPFLRVSQLVRSAGVKAVLSGEGADECFLGYGWQRSPAARRFRWAERVARRLTVAAPIPAHYSLQSPSAQLLSIDLHNRFENALDIAARHDRAFAEDGTRAGFTPLLTLDALGYNLRTLLQRNDAMGMAASIESRFPYLDARLVGLATNLPYAVKRRRRWPLEPVDKWVLRKVADRYLPEGLSRRAKAPFRVDAVRRMQIPSEFFYGGYVADYFEIGPKQIDYLVGHASHTMLLKLLHLEIWLAVCIAQDAPSAVTPRLRSNISIRPANNR